MQSIVSLYQNLGYFISGLKAAGVQDVVVSPGSRNAPIIAVLLQQGFKTYSVADERSAGFFALGLARVEKKPVALTCTSGTALLNYHPAVAEAYYQEIPLVVLSADRPPEQIDVWEGQAIRQNHSYAQLLGPSFQIDLHAPQQDLYNQWNEAALILQQKNIPVHFNIPIQAPFYIDQLPQNQEKIAIPNLPTDPPKYWSDALSGKVMVIVGQMDAEDPQITQFLNDVIQKDNVLVLADALSPYRHFSSCLHWQLSLRKGVFPDAPDHLISFGKGLLSKELRTFLTTLKELKHYHLGSEKFAPNAFQSMVYKHFCGVHLPTVASHIVAGKPYGIPYATAPKNAIQFSESMALQTLFQHIELPAKIFVGNSMPVRWVSWFQHLLKDGVSIWGNRGTSGIDGCSSTAVGVATQFAGTVYLITGDVSFYYDLNAFWKEQLPSNLKVVLLNNGGGRIFRMIEGPEKQESTRYYQETPTDFNAQNVCLHFGLRYFAARNKSLEQLADFMSCSETALLEIFTDFTTDQKYLNQLKKA